MNIDIDLTQLILDPVPRVLIGFTGVKQSGKDSAAAVLRHVYGVTQYAFAEPLKKGYGEHFGFSQSQIYGAAKDAVDPYWGISPREVYQYGGTEEYRDRVHQDFWVKRLHKELLRENFSSFHGGRFTITDVRFSNELDYVLQNRGYIIRINRSNFRSADSGIAGHRSELNLQHQDFCVKAEAVGRYHVIENIGTLADLEKKTLDLFDKIYPIP